VGAPAADWAEQMQLGGLPMGKMEAAHTLDSKVD